MEINWLHVGYLVLGAASIGALHLFNVAAGTALRIRARQDLERTSRGHLVLTFDDGPGIALQRDIVEILRRHDVKATFFVLGLRAESLSQYVLDLQREGHEIGSHGFAHLNACRTDPWTISRDVDKEQRVLSSLGITPRVYRPAFGRLTLMLWLKKKIRSQRLLMWTHAIGDTVSPRPDADAVVRRVLDSGGGVVLLHSHDRYGDEERERFIMAVLERLLVAAQKNDLRVVTCSQLLGA